MSAIVSITRGVFIALGLITVGPIIGAAYLVRYALGKVKK